LRVHLRRLEELEYLLVHRGGRGQSFVYELLFERQGDFAKPVLPGLIDIEKLKTCRYDPKNAGARPGPRKLRRASAGPAWAEGACGTPRQRPTCAPANYNNAVHPEAGSNPLRLHASPRFPCRRRVVVSVPSQAAGHWLGQNAGNRLRGARAKS
jgi:hypothetical protein